MKKQRDRQKDIYRETERDRETETETEKHKKDEEIQKD